MFKNTHALFHRLSLICLQSIVITFSCMNAFAAPAKTVQQQEISISGKVVDATGDPLLGVTVIITGTQIGVSTDFDGHFTLRARPEQDHFTFSYLGHNSKTVLAEDNMLVVLEKSTYNLDEIVVIGYGKQSKRQLTTAIDKLNMDNVSKRNVTSANQLLQGELPGVNVTMANGTPGARSRVSIRGVSSINGDNEPLYVIDGIPLSKANASYNYSGEYVQDPLSLINPSDIESIDVLKDAAATAIYGSRGANGVIIINTKQGELGKPKINVSQTSGFQLMPNKISLLNSEQYIQMQQEAVSNYNNDLNLTPGQSGYIDIDNVLGVVPSNLVDQNWQDLIIREVAKSNQSDFSISGATEKVNYYNSVGYLHQEGMIKKSSLKRYSIRSNVNYTPSDRFDLGFHIAGNYTESTSIPNGDQGTALFQRSLEQRPYDSPYLENGDYAVGGKDILRHNALIILDKDHTVDKNYQALINLFASYRITDGLSFRSSYNTELRLGHGNRRQELEHPYNGGKGWINDSRNTRFSQTFDNVLDYTTYLGSFDINATLGHSFYSDTYNSNSLTGREFPSDDFKHINAATIVTGSSTKSEYAIQSYFFRTNLGYKNTYLLSASLRYDGSSKFHKDNRYDYFPSLSGAWIFSNESFLEDFRAIDFGKIRLSWGETGNQDGIGNYSYFALAQGGYNYDNSTGLNTTAIGNPDLKWEVNTQTNLGLDLNLFNDRISFSYDYFIKKSKDLLYQVPTLQTSGFSSMTKNIGSIENKGHEIFIRSRNIQTNNFDWNSSLNLSFIKNEVTGLLGDGVLEIGGWNAIIEGQPLGVFWGYKHDGIYQNEDQIPDELFNMGVRPGDIRFVDKDNNGVIDSKDKMVIGSPYPDVYGGFTNNFRYKNFDLSVFLTFSLGNDIASAWRTGLDHLGARDYNNTYDSYKDRWTGENTSDWTPRASKNGWNLRNSSYYIEDGSYLRLKNITLGYNLPQDLTKRYNIDNIRVYTSVSNLFTLSSYSGYDPEAASGVDAKTTGIDNLVTPQSRSVLFGVNIQI